MTPDQSTIERSLRSYCALGMGISPSHCIEGNANAPPPAGLYASLLLISGRRRGGPFRRVSAMTDHADHQTMRSVVDRYSLQAYRTGARDAIRRFSVWVDSQAGRDAATDFVVHRAGDVRQIDEIVASAWEERAGLELDIGYYLRITEAIPLVEAVDITLREGDDIHIIPVEEP